MTAPTGTPEEIFERVYRQYYEPTRRFILSKVRSRELAHDLAQELFTEVWLRDVSRGLKTFEDPADHYGPLLQYRARQVMSHHFRTKRSQEVTVDFTDKEEPAARRLGAAADVGTPHLAQLYAALESAKDELTEAANAYRRAMVLEGGAKSALNRCRTREATEQSMRRLAHRAAARQLALQAFKAAADEVARIRAEWNRAAHDMNTPAVTR